MFTSESSIVIELLKEEKLYVKVPKDQQFMPASYCSFVVFLKVSQKNYRFLFRMSIGATNQNVYSVLSLSSTIQFHHLKCQDLAF